MLEAQEPASVRVEAEDNSLVLRRSARVCVVAHWEAEGRVTRSTCELLRALEEVGFAVMLVSSAPGDAPLSWTTPRPEGVTVLRRPNIGYDFGSWATALARIPELLSADHLLLMNDSLAGPFASPAPLFEGFLATRSRFWGLTDSLELEPHVQSYCLGFKGGLLEHTELLRFWRGIRVEVDKRRIIERYEIALSRLVRRMGITPVVAFPAAEVVEGPVNPSVFGWRRLIERGFPFVKRTVLDDPARWSPDEPVEDILRRRFGVEVGQWV